jgi:hypothetical protein
MACPDHPQALQQKIEYQLEYKHTAGKATGLSRFLFSETLHIPFPFSGQQTTFLGVAFLAAGNQIKFFRSSPPANGDNMIHGQLCREKTPLAIVTNPKGYFSLPPLACPYFPGTGPFFFYGHLIHKGKWVHPSTRTRSMPLHC